MKPISLRELVTMPESPDAETVLVSLKDYAEGGWAIDPRSIDTIIRKTNLTIAQLEEAKQLMEKGVEVQKKMHGTEWVDAGNSRVANEYRQAAEDIGEYIKQKTAPAPMTEVNDRRIYCK